MKVKRYFHLVEKERCMRETGSGKTPENLVIALNIELKNKSLNSISKATGVGISALHRYQRGIGEPTKATLGKLSDHFKVSVLWLRGDSPLSYEVEQQFYSSDFNKKELLDDLMSTARSLDSDRLTLLKEKAWELLQ